MQKTPISPRPKCITPMESPFRSEKSVGDEKESPCKFRFDEDSQSKPSQMQSFDFKYSQSQDSAKQETKEDSHHDSDPTSILLLTLIRSITFKENSLHLEIPFRRLKSSTRNLLRKPLRSLIIRIFRIFSCLRVISLKRTSSFLNPIT